MKPGQTSIILSVLLFFNLLTVNAASIDCRQTFESTDQIFLQNLEQKKKPELTTEDILKLPPNVPRVIFDPARAGARPLKKINHLRVFEFNMLNLYFRFKSLLSEGEAQNSPQRKKDNNQNVEKPIEKLQASARIILSADPDILILTEVDNLPSLEKFNQDFLDGRYRSLLFEGNDQRGIDIGFYIKKDLPFDIEMRSFSYLKEDDGSDIPIFSRDLPVLLFRASGDRKAKPFFAVLGTHLKSKKGSGLGDGGAAKREKQTLTTVEIIRSLEKEFGQDLPILLGGDFNNEVHQSPEFKSLYEAGFQDSLILTGQQPQPTHAYFRPDGTPDPAQIDSIMLNAAFQKTKALLSSKVLPHLDENNNPLAFPLTFSERETRASDHVPILIELDFRKLTQR
jgi:hypothetical protein